MRFLIIIEKEPIENSEIKSIEKKEEQKEEASDLTNQVMTSAMRSIKGTPSKAELRSFQEHWKDDYLGLRYDKDKDLMFCDICIAHSTIKAKNVFIQGTKKNYRRLELSLESLP